jgi:stringent starvation protein B
MSEATPKGKRELLESLLERGMVMVVLDARRPGVAVPPHLARDPQLRLNLSWRFGFSMELDDWGVKATLTFGGQPFLCRLPWNSIYVMVSHAERDQQYLFPTDLPEELQRLAAGAGPEDGEEEEEGLVADEETAEVGPEAEPEARPAFARRAHLAVVEGGAATDPVPETAGEEGQGEPAGPGPDREPPRPGGGRPALRLVK